MMLRCHPFRKFISAVQPPSNIRDSFKGFGMFSCDCLATVWAGSLTSSRGEIVGPEP